MAVTLIENNLPEGWVWTTLSIVADINPPKPAHDMLPPDAPVTFVPMPAVDAESGVISRPETRPFSQVRKGYTAFREGDVIMAKITPCMENGKAAVVRDMKNGLGFGSTEFHVLRSNGSALPEYIYHFIRQEYFRKAAEAEMTGSVGQKRVPAEFLKQSEIPLPPLVEQKRIVAKVEELLTRVNATKERLAKVSLILKRFRQAVLAAACSGRLTADWRENNSNIKPASELLKKARGKRKGPLQKVQNQEVNTNDLPTIPESWAYTSMGELEIFIGSGITPLGGKSVYVKQGVPFIRSQNVYPTGLVIRDMAFITREIHNKMYRTKLKEKDVLLNITGASIGRATYVPENFGEGNVNQHVCIIRLEEVVTYKFTTIFLNSPIGQDLIFSTQSGVTREGLNYDQIRNFIIPIPPIEEQHEIVRRVEAMFKLADAVEKRVASATTRAEKLTQAILAKAFRGELVPTEAELARREGRSYEPASELLARIKSHRESKEVIERRHRNRT